MLLQEPQESHHPNRPYSRCQPVPHVQVHPMSRIINSRRHCFCPLFGRLRCFFPHPAPAAIGTDPRLQAPANARSATSPEAASPARAVPITARPLWCPADSEIRVFTCIGISTPGVWLLCHFYRPPLECRGTQNNLGRRSILGAEVPDGPGFAHSSNQCHIMDGVDCLHPFCC